MREILELTKPVRTAAVIAAVATLLGSVNLCVSDATPSHVVAAAICYGVILGWLSVGLALSAGRAHARWLWRSLLVPIFGLAIMMAGLYQRFETAASWWLLTGGIWLTLISCVLWGAASCIVAGLGWCSYIRRRLTKQMGGPLRQPNQCAAAPNNGVDRSGV